MILPTDDDGLLPFDDALRQPEAPQYPKGATLEERFRLFHERNPHVLRALARVALRLRIEHGLKRGSIQLVFERVRWLYAIQTRGDEYALNNSYAAFYSRLLAHREPLLAGFFEVREQHAATFDPATIKV